MKRHQSLTPLSREHHSALLLAQLLKKNAPDYKGMPAEPNDKVTYAHNQYVNVLKEHFIKEELLLQKVKGLNKELDSLATEIIREHKELTEEFLALQSPGDLPEKLHALGIKLEQHIRKEERVLFPLIERSSSETLLAEISPLLT